ncbi:hypothetical protein SLEP1_g27789 [Rubroshorea leprosula]|uniref:Uncharacterized protein n=1 Tax=Rubroshorea leprosula TaxID=152421 RepID=A0AAV5JRH9_9ROSI|nr:hypothetical protein SLEP1_g27789 [Rubroshorea leprosula]
MGGRANRREEGCMQPYPDRYRSEKNCQWDPASNRFRDIP